MPGVHLSLINCEQLYLELVGNNDYMKINSLMTPALKKFMNAMNKYPSIIRTQYACALLNENNSEKVQKLKKRFEKTTKNYPYISEVESETELMKIAFDRYNSLCS